MKAIAVIPARYGSTRFPGKPLANINGRPMIRHVYEQCMRAKLISETIVATDDRRILECVEDFGGRAVMTSVKHRSGTDRVIEACKGIRYDVAVNVQGDEPFIPPVNIDKVIEPFANDRSLNVATLAVAFPSGSGIDDPNKVKVIRDKNGFAVYFSRSVIPFNSSGRGFRYLKHIGIYAYRKNFLGNYSKLRPSALEDCEKLEQLRIIENGHKIKVILTKLDSISVDTPGDLKKLFRYA